MAPNVNSVLTFVILKKEISQAEPKFFIKKIAKEHRVITFAPSCKYCLICLTQQIALHEMSEVRVRILRKFSKWHVLGVISYLSRNSGILSAISRGENF